MILILGCAEVAPPPGGEQDRSAPGIVYSYPPNGAVNIPLSDQVIIGFSERIQRPSDKKGVFISPRPKEPPRVKWGSDKLVITFADSFRTDQTYIISFGTNIKDLRQNSIDSNAVIAFSTGSIIDSGRISGYITAGDGGEADMHVALYPADLLSQAQPIDSVYPDYIAQSNRAGFFSFEFLPPREYLMIAFTDRNRDERFNPASEYFALPDRSIVMPAAYQLEGLTLPLNPIDTNRLKIISVVQTPDNLIRLRLSKDAATASVTAHPASLLLKSIVDTTTIYRGIGVMESYDENSSVLTFSVEKPDTGLYNIELLQEQDSLPLYFPEFQFQEREDKQPPMIEATHPDSLPIMLDDREWSINFSEPIDTAKITPQSITTIDVDGNPVELSLSWASSNLLRIIPESLNDIHKARLVVSEFDVADLSGNLLGDSLREYPINIISPDSLGTVTGQTVILLEDKKEDQAVLRFQRIDNRQTFSTKAADGNFSIELPGGKYLLTGFIDSDGNSKLGRGSVFPLRFSETMAVYPDTITSRARFETAGIKLEFK